MTAFKGFESEFGDLVNEMFTNHRIDGKVRTGKMSGAWCYPWLGGKTGFILSSFNGNLSDIYTLAHENGHAIHNYFMATEQNMSSTNTDIGGCLAETASIFGELLLTEKLLTEAKTDEEKKEVLVKILDNFGMTIFQVSARYFFETSLYDAIKRKEYLDGETISKYWVQERDKIFGNSIEWLDEMKWEWTMKPHYFLPRRRYYNYPYIYANLLVFALYRLYKEQGKAFVPKLKSILAAGSTKSPKQLASELGFNLENDKFWELGMKTVIEFIDQLEELMNNQPQRN